MAALAISEAWHARLCGWLMRLSPNSRRGNENVRSNHRYRLVTISCFQISFASGVVGRVLVYGYGVRHLSSLGNERKIGGEMKTWSVINCCISFLLTGYFFGFLAGYERGRKDERSERDQTVEKDKEGK
jgi:hypothetical protein